MSEVERLTRLFALLGAREPEGWALAQMSDERQLHRFLFLRQAWGSVVDAHDGTWIDEELKRARASPRGPGSQSGPVLERLLAQGAASEDLTTLVRVMQWQLLSRFCYLLEDPGDVEEPVRQIAWRLFEVDEHQQPVAPISGLHESVLEMDPEGREMRPPE
jgi:hypothetical protein